MVYIINQEGKPLMPTKRHGKVRRLLQNGLAKVVKRKPFTIQLCYETTNHIQDISLGVDSGYTYIGASAVTETEEVFSSEVTMVNGIKERNEERSSYRGNRRGRLRYRKKRFDNRKRKEGWLAPSIQHKLDSQLRYVDTIHQILPIKRTTIEVGNFDIQKIRNTSISGKEYQEGVQKDFWNLREYILHRDGHKCQNPNCKNKSKTIILCVHHIIYRSNGGTDDPNNLITLCDKCHTPKNHEGFLKTWRPKVKPLREATFMNIVRWRLVNTLDCEHTYGCVTKTKRIAYGIEKSHVNDAFVIAGGQNQQRIQPFMVQQTKRNNRSLRKFYDAKYLHTITKEKVSGKETFNGRTKRNKNTNGENLRKYRGHKLKKGSFSLRKERYFYQPNDLVLFEGRQYFVAGSMNKGKSVKLKDCKKSPNPNKLTIIKFGKGFTYL